MVKRGPPPTLLIKSNHDNKSDKDFVNIKLCGDRMSEKSDRLLIQNGLVRQRRSGRVFFVRSYFNMTLEASGTLQAGINIQHLCTLVHGDALLQFDMLSSDVKSYTPCTSHFC